MASKDKFEVCHCFVWREITEDGLVKKPPKQGPYYEQDDVNTYGGYETELAAMKALEEFVNRQGYGVYDDFVLVKIYKAHRVD